VTNGDDYKSKCVISFAMEQLTYESFDKESNGDHVEDKEVENMLAVLLEECSEAVPLFTDFGPILLVNRINVETCHSERDMRHEHEK
jgi:hypothetical protein